MKETAVTIVGLFLIFNTVTSSKVLLISMDGFRWDYIQNFSTPNFDEFARNGVTSKYLTSPFITKTFPCHYTIATGLYEESHGIVANRFYDPLYREYFDMSMDSRWWDEAEPLWVKVQRHGLKSGVYFWPGSEAEIRGRRPNVWTKYNRSVPFTERVDTAINWLSNDSFNIDFAMVYFHEPDSTGHKFGPYSSQVRNKVSEMDGILGYLVEGVKNAGIWDILNIIVTSDHGMTETDLTNRLIDLRRYIDFNAIEYMSGTADAVLTFQSVKGREGEVYTNLSTVEHMTVYKKEKLPERWHYKDNGRILPIVLVADEGWIIAKDASKITSQQYGGHGYDNALSSMKPIFFARGPDFRSNVTLAPFNLVDIYPLVCKLFNIEAAPNNGTLNNTIDALVSGQTKTNGFITSCLMISILNVLINCYAFQK